MGAHKNRYLAVRHPFEELCAGDVRVLLRPPAGGYFGGELAALTAGNEANLHAEMGKVADEGFKVLARKDLGGRHVGNLLAREHCRIGRNCRNGGLTRAHVTFQKAHHGARPREVSEDCRNSARLRGGKRKGEARGKLPKRAFRRGKARRAELLVVLAVSEPHEVEKEHLFKRKALLRRSRIRETLGSVNVEERGRETRQFVARAQVLGQGGGESLMCSTPEEFPDMVSEPLRGDSRACGVHRGKAFGTAQERGSLPGGELYVRVDDRNLLISFSHLPAHLHLRSYSELFCHVGLVEPDECECAGAVVKRCLSQGSLFLECSARF